MRRSLIKPLALAFMLSGIAADTAQAQEVFTPGFVKAEVFTGFGGVTLANLTSNQKYIDNAPDRVEFVKFLEYPPGADDGTAPPGNVYDNYGVRLTGFIIPKETASYVFYLAADDGAGFWLSTDDTAANLVQIAAEPTWNPVRAWSSETRRPGCTATPPDCENVSNAISLQANKRYYFRALMKEAGGGDNVAVTWIKSGEAPPEDTVALPIGAEFLGTLAGTVPAITGEPADTTVAIGATATFSVKISAVPGVTYQWFKGSSAIADATGSTLVTAPLAAGDNGAKYKVTVTAGGTSITSREATVSVVAPVASPGFLKFEAFPGIGSTAVDSLFNDQNFIDNIAAETLFMSSFNSRTVYPNDSHENYGARITGWIVPTESGDYDFFLRSDDASQLLLSSDDNAANASIIAEEFGCCGPYEEVGASETTAAPISLVAGRRYAVVAYLKEGGGGDYIQVAWRKTTDTTPAGALSPIPGAFLQTTAAPIGSVTITTQPQSVSAPRNSSVTFTVDYTATGGTPYVQWQRNGVNIPGANAKSYTTPALAAADNGAKYRAVVLMPGVAVNSSEATLTVTEDTTPPSITKVSGSDKFNTVTVTFSEAVDATAGTAANYAIAGLTVSAATVVSPTTVRLTTSTQAQDTGYTLVVSNVKDTAGLTIAAPGNSKNWRSFRFGSGFMKAEFYTGITGNSVENNLKTAPNYPDSPNEVRFVSGFEGPTGYGDNYGSRVSGFITPTETADYIFFISTDDNGELWLSTDEDPAKVVLIATEPTWNGVRDWVGTARRPGCADGACENRSGPIRLTAGRRYYVEAFNKEGGGGDNLAVTAKKASDPDPANGSAPLSGNMIGTYLDPSQGAPIITTQPKGARGAAGTLTVDAIGSEPFSYKWQKVMGAVGGALNWVDLAGATDKSYAIANVNLDTMGHYRVIVSNAEGTVTSSAANVVPAGTFFIEAEDFNYDSGKYKVEADSPTYAGLAYNGLSAVPQIDYNDGETSQNIAYRADQGVAMVSHFDTARGDVTLTTNYKVGWNDNGNWYNYTRTFPDNTYYVLGSFSSGGADIAGRLDEVTAGAKTETQTVKKLGEFNAPATAGWDTFVSVPLKDDTGALSKVSLSGERTVRFTVLPGNLDFSYLAFVPATSGGGGGGPTLNFTVTAGNIRLEWSGGGTLESADSITGPWTTVAGGASGSSYPLSGTARFFRIRQ